MNAMPYKPRRIVIVGAGSVGSTTAYTLFLRGRADEIVLIDTRRDKAVGDALDMEHGTPFVGSIKAWAGEYADCRDADIVIITAGAAQKPGETRMDLLKKNAAIVRNIVEEIRQYTQNAILLMTTNPVDVLSYLAWKASGYPAQRVIGTGTLLDTARFRYLLSKELKVDPRSIHAHIVGEHGDTEVPIWSRTNVAGVPVDIEADKRAALFKETRDAAYQIIQAKGATYYAIALSVDRICAAILNNEDAVLQVSALQNSYGISEVYMGSAAIIGRGGVQDLVHLNPTEEEIRLLNHSADELRARIQELEQDL